SLSPWTDGGINRPASLPKPCLQQHCAVDPAGSGIPQFRRREIRVKTSEQTPRFRTMPELKVLAPQGVFRKIKVPPTRQFGIPDEGWVCVVNTCAVRLKV